MAEAMLARAARLIPALGTRKGLSGRVAIVGGSEEYTGAPFLAAMAALRTGADLVHVLCPPGAAQAIKSYSPDLIVHPILESKRQAEIFSVLERMHAVVLGPGIGREPSARELVESIFVELRKKQMPLIMDADALYFVANNPSFYTAHPNLILTPNPVELDRLFEGTSVDASADKGAAIKALSEKLRDDAKLGPVIMAKGHEDLIVRGAESFTVKAHGSPRRVGGQGDILCGVTGAFVAWANVARNADKGKAREEKSHEEESPADLVAAAAAASYITKHASELAFAVHHRGMVASDMLTKVPLSFREIMKCE